MPLPFILAGVAAVAGAVGIAKGAKSVSNNKDAKDLYERAEKIYDRAKDNLEKSKTDATEALTELGEIKLLTWNDQIGRFVELVNKVSRVKVTGQVAVDDNKQAVIGNKELLEMKGISLKASEVVSGGLQSLGTGALAGVASYGGAMMFATASTGTAITTLSGVAATNATLAWLGGGSLAAGGLGMAGGAAILGGIVAGPALAIGGILMESKSKKNLAEAKANYAQAKEAAEELNSAASMLDAITSISNLFSEAIIELNTRMDDVLLQLEQALLQAESDQVHKLGYKVRKVMYRMFGKEMTLDYKKFTMEQKQILHLSYAYAQTMKKILETPILDKSGALDESSVEVLESSQQLLLE